MMSVFKETWQISIYIILCMVINFITIGFQNFTFDFMMSVSQINEIWWCSIFGHFGAFMAPNFCLNEVSNVIGIAGRSKVLNDILEVYIGNILGNILDSGEKN